MVPFNCNEREQHAGGASRVRAREELSGGVREKRWRDLGIRDGGEDSAEETTGMAQREKGLRF